MEPRPVVIEEPSVLIRIPKLWHPGISAEDLYDATRAYWKVGQRRQTAEVALAVAEGIVREVYVIDAWHRAGTTGLRSRVHTAVPADRWEFTGSRAPESLRAKYLARFVKHYFKHGNQNPIFYVNC